MEDDLRRTAAFARGVAVLAVCIAKAARLAQLGRKPPPLLDESPVTRGTDISSLNCVKAKGRKAAARTMGVSSKPAPSAAAWAVCATTASGPTTAAWAAWAAAALASLPRVVAMVGASRAAAAASAAPAASARLPSPYGTDAPSTVPMLAAAAS